MSVLWAEFIFPEQKLEIAIYKQFPELTTEQAGRQGGRQGDRQGVPNDLDAFT